jgi:hypothetical protein
VFHVNNRINSEIISLTALTGWSSESRLCVISGTQEMECYILFIIILEGSINIRTALAKNNPVRAGIFYHVSRNN